jgi:hypothetical protein
MEAAREWGWQVAIHPEDLPRLSDAWQELRASQEPGEWEARLQRFDGVYRWFLFRVEPQFDETGKIVKWYGTNTDIDDRKWAEAVLAAEKQIFETITGGSSLATILEGLCRVAENRFSGSLCAILFLDADGERLRKGTALSFPPDFIAVVDGVTIGPRAGSCGTAAYRKETVIVSDINTDPQQLPAHRPRVERLIACPPEQCICGPCGRPTPFIGYEQSEPLDVEPAKYVVVVTKREKRACQSCEEQGVTCAPLPARIISERFGQRSGGHRRGGEQIRRPPPALPSKRHFGTRDGPLH